jgi:MYXO-CTERM domain-containing protein
MSLICFALLLSGQASAYRHSRFRWAVEDGPVSFWFDGDPADAWLSEEEQRAAVERAFAEWEAVLPCGELQLTVEGTIEQPDGFSYTDGVHTVGFGDVADDLPEGLPVRTYLGPALDYAGAQTPFGEIDSDDYFYSSDADVIFGADIPWITLAEAEEGCVDAYVVEHAALWAVGYALGLDVSCTDFEIGIGDCPDPDAQAAVMSESFAPCDLGRVSPGPDDIAGLRALYASSGVLEIEPEEAFVPPAEVCLSVDPVVEPGQTLRWDLGDGSTAEGQEVCHRYEAPGVYEVKVIDADGCEQSPIGLVYACDAPAIPAGQAHAFTWALDDLGATVRLSSLTADPRCLVGAEWRVYDESHQLLAETEWVAITTRYEAPELRFDGAGISRIEVEVQGRTGDLEDGAEVDAGGDGGDTGDGGGGCGCAAGGSPGAPLVGLLGLLSLLGASLRRSRGAALRLR